MLVLLALLAAASADPGPLVVLGTDSDELARHIGELDVIHDRDGNAHVVWTATRMEAGVDHLGNPRWWRSRRLHVVHSPSHGWSAPEDLGHGYATPTLAADPAGGVVLLAYGYNQDPAPDRFGTPPGNGAVSWRRWTAGGGWTEPRALLPETPRLLHGATALGTPEGVRVAWAPWDGSWERVHAGVLGPDGLVQHEILAAHGEADLTHPAWSATRDGPVLVGLAQGANRGMPWVVRHGGPTGGVRDVGTLSDRWRVAASRQPGTWTAAWLAAADPTRIDLWGEPGLASLALPGVPRTAVRLALCGDHVAVGQGRSVFLYRSDGEGGWHRHEVLGVDEEVRGVGVDVWNGRVLVVAALHGATDRVVAWEAAVDEVPWTTARGASLPAPERVTSLGR